MPTLEATVVVPVMAMLVRKEEVMPPLVMAQVTALPILLQRHKTAHMVLNMVPTAVVLPMIIW